MIVLSKLSKQAPTSQAKPEQGEWVEEKKKREGGEKKKNAVYRSGLSYFHSSHVTPKLKFKETFEAW